MPAAFLHGVETFNLTVGPRVVKAIKSGVIGLVGTAPIHQVQSPYAAAAPNALSLYLNDRSAPQYGPTSLAAYTIPRALNAIARQGAALVMVVNVFDPTTHKTTVASASQNITNKKVQLADTDIISATVTTSTSTACVEGTDYTLDRVNGVITVISGGLLAPGGVAAAALKVGYDKANPAAAGIADGSLLVGGINGSGIRTGMQAWLNGGSLYGYGPKILIAPGFSSLANVRSGMVTLAQQSKLRAVVLADVAVGATVTQVISGRGSSTPVDLTAADARLAYGYPHIQFDALEPYSQTLAGIMAANDATNGYWTSPSNKEIVGAQGIETPVSFAVNDPNCDANQVNGAGVVTVACGYGQPPTTWGNRSSAFPNGSDITTFLSVQRTIDMVEEALELASKVFNDQNINDVLVSAVLETTNAFIRTLIARKALMPGSRVEYFVEDNPDTQLEAGQIVFTRTFCPPTPAERITYKAVLDTTLLSVAASS